MNSYRILCLNRMIRPSHVIILHSSQNLENHLYRQRRCTLIEITDSSIKASAKHCVNSWIRDTGLNLNSLYSLNWHLVIKINDIKYICSYLELFFFLFSLFSSSFIFFSIISNMMKRSCISYRRFTISYYVGFYLVRKTG